MYTISKKILFKYITGITAIIGIFLCMQVSANPGSIDPSFDIKLPVGFDNRVTTLTTQSDGKIIVGGTFTTYKGIAANKIIRLNADGTKDASFTIGGGFGGFAVMTLAIQGDGKILVGGWFTTYSGAAVNNIIRLNADGTKDTSFTIGSGFNGTDSYVRTLAIQSDGKILVGGNFTTYKGAAENRIIRLNADGTKDDSFTIGSGFNNYVTTLTTQSDGKILVGGRFTSYNGVSVNRIVRLNADGTKDDSFIIGSGFNGNVNTLALQNDGKIIVGGDFTTYSGSTTNNIIRLNADGTKDASFTIGGGFNVYVNTLLLQTDGKILVGGLFNTYKGIAANRIIRLNSDGIKDDSFIIGSGFNGNVNTLALQNDGKIIVGGDFTIYSGAAVNRTIRLNADGTKNTSFIVGDGFENIVNTLVVQSDGKVIVGGNFTSYSGESVNKIIRLNADGTKDDSFIIGSGFNGNVNTLALQNDGKIIVGGMFTAYKGVAANRIIRLNADGTKDDSFTIGGGFNQFVDDLAVQSGGKIVVGGRFTTYSGATANKIIRLNADGTKDGSFTIGSGFSSIDYIFTLAIQSDGKVIVGGTFTGYNGASAKNIIRLNADGTKDDSFIIGGGFAGSAVSTLALQSDGKVIVGGNFTSYSGAATYFITRLNADGTKDSSFIVGNGFSTNVEALALQSDGKIVVGGRFTNKIIRLNADGTKDSSFIVGNGFNQFVDDLAVKSDGKILVGGSFTTYQGMAVGYLTSLYGDSDLVILPLSTNTGILTTRFTDKGYIQQTGGELSGNISIWLVETNGSVPLPFEVKNQDIKLSVPVDVQFKEDDNTTNYTGIISVPMTKSISSVNDEEVISAFKVGSSTESIKLAGGVATLLVPASGKNIGDSVDIYYSEDNGVTWYPQTTTTVIDNGGQPFVEFTTNHFTDFAITTPIPFSGSFVINNDAASTTVTGVTLNIFTTPPASGMRFSDDGITRPAWENYTTTKARTLPGAYGNKTVYAQFDADGDNIADITTQDTISYAAEGGGTVEGNLRLEITTTSGSCTYGTSLNIGSHPSQFDAYNMTGSNFSSSFSCVDTQGLLDWTMTIQASGDLSNGTQTIPNTNVSMIVSPNYLSEGACTTGTNQTTWAEIGTQPKTIIWKAGNQGDICTLTTDTVNLAVHIPASQAVGLYTGTLTLNMPF